MSTLNAMADVQTGQEVVLPERMPSEQTEPKFTADQVEKKCPDRLRQIGKLIAARLEKIDKQIKQAENHSISVNQLIAQAKELCDEGGFNAFREKFFPDLGTSRVYELLAIASNKKTVEETRASNRLGVAKHRANKAEAPVSVTVTENREPQPGARGGPKADDGLEATSTTTEHTTEQGTPSKIEADNAEASTEKGKTECAKREAELKTTTVNSPLAGFKSAVDWWFPKMDHSAKCEAVEYAIAKSGGTVSCASGK